MQTQKSKVTKPKVYHPQLKLNGILHMKFYHSHKIYVRDDYYSYSYEPKESKWELEEMGARLCC